VSPNDDNTTVVSAKDDNTTVVSAKDDNTSSDANATKGGAKSMNVWGMIGGGKDDESESEESSSGSAIQIGSGGVRSRGVIDGAIDALKEIGTLLKP
jgi:hypothetical protein